MSKKEKEELLEEEMKSETPEGASKEWEEESEDKPKEDKPKEDKPNELDFGIEEKKDEDKEEPTEEPSEEVDLKALVDEAELKPDFKTVAEIFLAMPEAKSPEDLTKLQTEYETFLKETLVPKIEKALGMMESGDSKKAGVSSKSSEKPKERVTTPLRNRK